MSKGRASGYCLLENDLLVNAVLMSLMHVRVRYISSHAHYALPHSSEDSEDDCQGRHGPQHANSVLIIDIGHHVAEFQIPRHDVQLCLHVHV